MTTLPPFAVQYRYEAVDADEEPLDPARLVAQVRRLVERLRKAVAG